VCPLNVDRQGKTPDYRLISSPKNLRLLASAFSAHPVSQIQSYPDSRRWHRRTPYIREFHDCVDGFFEFYDHFASLCAGEYRTLLPGAPDGSRLRAGGVQPGGRKAAADRTSAPREDRKYSGIVRGSGEEPALSSFADRRSPNCVCASAISGSSVSLATCRAIRMKARRPRSHADCGGDGSRSPYRRNIASGRELGRVRHEVFSETETLQAAVAHGHLERA